MINRLWLLVLGTLLLLASGAWADITTGLVYYLPLTEGTGTSVTDQASGLTASFANTPVWDSTLRQLGMASLSFQVADADRVSTTNNAVLNPTTAMSFMAWVRPTDATVTNSQRVIIKNVPGVSAQYFLQLHSTGFLRCAVTVTTGGTLTTTSPTLADATWAHLACTWDGSNLRAYVNGVEAGGSPSATTGTITTNTDSLRIGTDESAAHFGGNVNEIRIYNRGLSQQDVVEAMRYPRRAVVYGGGD